jgi:hypothetical protein
MGNFRKHSCFSRFLLFGGFGRLLERGGSWRTFVASLPHFLAAASFDAGALGGNISV